MKPLTTTLNAIRKHDPCEDSWKKLLKGLRKTKPDDKPLRFTRILDICGIEDALWACRAAPQYDKTWRLLIVRYAREVQHLMTDKRSLAALDVAERYARGKATDGELTAARIAAGDAAWAATGAAARTAARSAAWAATGAAAWAATGAAAEAAAGAATWAAAWAAAGAAAGAAARKQQEVIARVVFAGKPVPKFKPRKP